MAQLAEGSLPKSKVSSSNSVIRKILCRTWVYCWKDENKEKDAGNDPFKKLSSQWRWSFFWKNGPSISLFLIYFRLFKQTLQFLQQIYVKNVHPVYCAGIWTHDLQEISLLPKPLDQGSCPRRWSFTLRRIRIILCDDCTTAAGPASRPVQ